MRIARVSFTGGTAAGTHRVYDATKFAVGDRFVAYHGAGVVVDEVGYTPEMLAAENRKQDGVRHRRLY